MARTFSKIRFTKAEIKARGQELWGRIESGAYILPSQRGKGFSFSINASLPKFLAQGIPPSGQLSVTVSPFRVRTGAPSPTTGAIADTSSFGKLIEDILNSSSMEEGTNLYVKETLSEMMEEANSSLKDAFTATLKVGASEWEPVSNERLARRAAMAALGAPNQLPPERNVHYTSKTITDTIDKFKFKVSSDKNVGNVRIEMSSAIPRDSHHPDFIGLHTGYKGPNEVKLSIMGLRLKNNPGVSSTGGKMIVPIGTSESNIFNNKFSRTGYEKQVKRKDGRTEWKHVDLGYTQKFTAVIGKGYIEYPSKSNPLPQGVPIGFVNKIDFKEHPFQDSETTNARPIFWSKPKGGNGHILFPRRVEDVLKKYKMIPSNYR